jgi:hypothetical protein
MMSVDMKDMSTYADGHPTLPTLAPYGRDRYAV